MDTRHIRLGARGRHGPPVGVKELRTPKHGRLVLAALLEDAQTGLLVAGSRDDGIHKEGLLVVARGRLLLLLLLLLLRRWRLLLVLGTAAAAAAVGAEAAGPVLGKGSVAFGCMVEVGQHGICAKDDVVDQRVIREAVLRWSVVARATKGRRGGLPCSSSAGQTSGRGRW